MEGPQFSTLAESKLYRSWGMDIIGMTNLQEAKLAREAEICYTTIALVTDYDCWHPDHDSVTVEMVMSTLSKNATTAQQIIAGAVERLPVRADVRVRVGAEVRARHAAGDDSRPGQEGPGADHRQVRWTDPIMKLIVTGSIAYDYLMSFPGKFTEHFLPEHLQRVSLSFLVDSMDKRRGGCAPNIAYTLALLGERPYLMGAAGQDFKDYGEWLAGRRRRHSLVHQVPDKFTASFFCSTDTENNQIASFYTGAMANAAELSFRTVDASRARHHFAERSGGDGPVRGGVPDARHSVHLRSRSAVRADVGRRAARRHLRRAPRDLQRLRVRARFARRPGWARTTCSARRQSLVITRGEEGCSLYEKAPGSGIGIRDSETQSRAST